MAEELQGLLERIQKDGFREAQEEKAKTISEARKESSDILDAAKSQAEEIVKKALAEAKAEKQKAESAIQQAARDIAITLKAELLKRMRNIVKDSIAEAMTPELMTRLINQMASAYFASKDLSDKAGLEVMLSPKDLDVMQKSLSASLSSNLRKKPEISLAHDISSGMKIGFKDNDVFLDFSDDAVADLICSYVSPKLAAIIQK